MLTLTGDHWCVHLTPMEEWEQSVEWDAYETSQRFSGWSGWFVRPLCGMAVDVSVDDATVAVWYGHSRGETISRSFDLVNQTYLFPAAREAFNRRATQCLYMYASDPLV
jgi:hypothetical protein